MDPLSIAIPSVFSVLTLALSWVMFHQKIGIDESIQIRADLRDCRADIVRLNAENEECKRAQDALRTENIALMRRLFKLPVDGG